MSLQLIQVQDLVKAQLYDGEDQVVQDAFRHFLQDRPDLRLRVAVHRYRTDEDLSLARAAAIAGVSLGRMKEIPERNGVCLRLGPASLEEARAEVAALDEWFSAILVDAIVLSNLAAVDRLDLLTLTNEVYGNESDMFNRQ